MNPSLSHLPPPEKPGILIVGYGDLGKAIGETLAEDGYSITGLRRSEHSHNTDIRMVTGDVTRPDTLAGLSTINPQILIYCVAAPEQSDECYRDHYVNGLRHVLAALDRVQNLRHVIFVSSSRVYGQTSEAMLNEADPATPADFGGIRLLEAEQLLTNLHCGHTALRLSGIYGPGRTRMLHLAGDPNSWPQQNTWTNRIHRDDAAAFVVFLIHRILSGLRVEDCYLVTDNYPAPQHEVLRWLAESMGNKALQIPITAPSGGKRLSNKRMLDAGFQLRYPNYQAGYATLLQQIPP